MCFLKYQKNLWSHVQDKPILKKLWHFKISKDFMCLNFGIVKNFDVVCNNKSKIFYKEEGDASFQVWVGLCEFKASLRLSFDFIYINHLHCFVCASELVKRHVNKWMSLHPNAIPNLVSPFVSMPKIKNHVQLQGITINTLRQA
jgi:hypothetical protein